MLRKIIPQNCGFVKRFSAKLRKKSEGSCKKDMCSRLKAVREALNLSQKEFGDKIGMAERTIQEWEANGNIPERRLKKVEETFNVNPDYLRKGKGEMFTKPHKIFLGGSYIGETANPENKLVQVTVYSLIGAGDPMSLEELEPIEKLYLPEKFVGKYRDAFRVDGDSMYDTIIHGAYVGFDVNDVNIIRNGKIYCLRVPHQGLILKRLYVQENRKVLIKGDNPKHREVEMSLEEVEDMRVIFARVKWRHQLDNGEHF